MPVAEKEAVKIHGPRRLVRDLSLHTAHGDGACAGHGGGDTGTLLMSQARPALHWRAGITQQGCSATAREWWGLELLCTEVFSICCNLCPGSGGTIEPSVRAVPGISKCKTVCGSLCVTYTGKVQKISVNCKRHVNRALLKNAC